MSKLLRFPEQDPLFRYTHRIRSRYGETDQMGYVYYGRYLEYFEVARTEMIRRLGMPYSEMEKEGVMLPVTEAALEYKAPVFYDEEMRVEVTIFEPPLVRLHTFYRVYTDRQSAPHVFGKVTLAFSDVESRKPRRAPDHFLQKLSDSGEA